MGLAQVVIAGIDPSSTCCGLAIMEGEEIITTECWTKRKNKSDSWNLRDYYVWLKVRTKPRYYADSVTIDMAVVEFLRVDRNVQSVRKISHYQAVSVLACKMQGLLVVEAHVKTARKEALGRGDLSKDEMWDAVKKLYPSHPFRRKDQGGEDEADAIVLALAGPGLVEGA